MKSRRWFVSLLALVIVSLMASVAAPVLHAAEPVRIGLVTPVSGPLSFGGNEVKNAVELAVERKGTLFGRPIELVVADGPDPTAAVSEFERLASREGINIILGGYGSAIEAATQRAAERLGVLLLGLVNWADELTAEKRDFYFRLNPNVSMFSRALAEQAIRLGKDVLGKDPSELRIGIVGGEDTAYVTDPILAALREMGVEPVQRVTYPETIRDFAPIITRLRSARLDILIVAQYTADGLLFRRQAKSLGFEPPITFGAGLVYDQPEFAQLGPAADGAIALSYTNPEMNPNAALGVAEFRQKYIEKVGHAPLTHALQAYSGTLFYLNVIEQVGSLDIPSIREALLAADVPPGILPSGWGVKFDPSNHQNIRAGQPFVLGQWQDQQYRVVWPETFATHELRLPW